MNSIKKMFYYSIFMSMSYLRSLACDCEDLLIRQFEQLEEGLKSGDEVQVNSFKKEAEKEKKKLESDMRNNQGKGREIEENLRLKIENIDAMLFVLDKTQEYKRNIDYNKQKEIEDALWEFVEYYPVVRGFVKDTIGLEFDLSDGA